MHDELMDITQAFTLAQNMIDAHGLSGWRVQRRNYKSTGGVTYYNIKTIGLSPRLIAKWTEEETRQIILHEIAHALVGPRHGHDAVWSTTARKIGYTGGRTHELPTEERRWIVMCPTCGEIGRRHRRSNKSMLCVQCRSAVSFVDSSAKASARA